MKTYEERVRSVQEKLQRKRTHRKVMKITAGALCLCILTGLFLYPIGRGAQDNPGQMHDPTEPIFVVNPDGKYARVIQALQKYDQECGSIDKDFIYGAEVPEAVPPTDAPNDGIGAGNSSVDVTDNQVQGVEEGDLIKRSQTHIFYLRIGKLEAYPIAGLETYPIDSCEIKAELTAFNSYYRNEEMYLSEDATRMTIIGHGYGCLFDVEKQNSYLQITSVDVSDPANMKVLDKVIVTGSLLSTRMIGDRMLLTAQYDRDYRVNYADATTFIPHIGTYGKMDAIPAENIIIPETLDSTASTLVVMLDSKDLKVIDTVSLMSYATEIYVSKDRIYANRNYVKRIEMGVDREKIVEMTDITCLDYSSEDLSLNDTFSVEGRVKNQYAMDEYDGVFRVVTTTQTRDVENLPGGYAHIWPKPSNVNLTCFKVGTWEQIAQVANFAPDGETAESVRFDGNYAYVCTAKVIILTDPVYFFDLTNLNNITYKDTGVIDGYSSSLVQLKDGFLMGIGFDNNRGLKVEIYAQTEEGVVSVCTYGGQSAFAQDYKAYYIDRENNIFGIPTNTGYVLLWFDGCQLVELAIAETDGPVTSTRGVIVDEYLYVFSPNKFTVQQVWQM